MKLLFLVVLSFASINHINSQNSQCRSSTTCIPLSQCPELLKLLRSRDQVKITQVQRAICGFSGSSTKVCCPSNTNTATTERPFVIGTPASIKIDKQKLLPSTICGRPSTDDKVLGGEPAPIGAYPWIVAMGYTSRGSKTLRFDCAGSLINDRYVLTAAHCLADKYLQGRTLSVLHLGDHDLKTEPNDCQIVPVLNINRCAPPHIVSGFESFIMHKDFDTRKRFSDDIGLVRLDKSIDFLKVNSFVAPICLPPANLKARSAAGGRDAVAAGWGFTENNDQSDILLRVNLPLADEILCTNRYKDQFLPEQLCVGGSKGKDTCSGDSGGPLVVSGPFGPPYLQIGIVSYGPFPCGLQQTPGVYTSVSDYVGWILENIEP